MSPNKQLSGIPKKLPVTPTPKINLQSNATHESKMQAIAEELARTKQSEVLRAYVSGSHLVVLLKDGRKYYVTVAGL